MQQKKHKHYKSFKMQTASESLIHRYVEIILDRHTMQVTIKTQIILKLKFPLMFNHITLHFLEAPGLIDPYNHQTNSALAAVARW